MANTVSYCGLVCETCPIYVGTREQDKDKQAQMRAQVAEMCAKHYGISCGAADINDCDGCRSGGRLFFGCDDCRIRNCAMARGIETCAQCHEYICSELEAFFLKDPSARDRLNHIKSRGRA
jgi:hypothetical protein